MSVGNQPSLNLSGIIALALIASLLSQSELKRSPIPRKFVDSS